MKVRKDLELFMLRAGSFWIEFIYVTSCLEDDVMSQQKKQLYRFGAYCATARNIVFDTEDDDEGEARRGIVRLAN
jgi:hypothetical protein